MRRTEMAKASLTMQNFVQLKTWSDMIYIVISTEAGHTSDK